MKEFETAFGVWVVRYRWWILLVSVVVFFAAASGLRYLTFNDDDRVFFSKDNPQLKAFEALEHTYTKNENVMFAIKPKDGKVFSRNTLATIEELTKKSWQIPYSNRVDSITNFQYSHSDGDDLVVEDLVKNAAELSSVDLRRIQDFAKTEPLLVNRLVSADGTVTGVNINVIKPGKSDQEVPQIATFARDLLKQMQTEHPDIDFYLAGSVMFNAAFNEASMGDMSTLVPIMYLVLLVMMGVLLRSVSGTAATMTVIGVSMLSALGLAGWLGFAITIPSANAPTIILTLAIADCIHILATMLMKMRHGLSKFDAIAESLRVNFQPVVLTSVTTAIGFLSMNFSDAPPFRDLGNIVAAGVMIAMVYALLFLPALMAVLPVKVKHNEKEPSLLIERLGSYVVSNRKKLWFATLSLIALTFFGIPQIKLDDNFAKYFDHSFDIRKATDFMESHLTGFDIIEYSLNAGESGGINRPDYLAKVDEFARWYRTQPGVIHVNTVTDTIKRLNQNMHGNNKTYYRLPEQRDLTAQYLLMYEMSLPFGLDLNNQINIDKSATRFTVSLRGVSSRQLRDTDEHARQWLRKNAPRMLTYGASESMMFAHISERNINQMLAGSALALILISAIMIFALRSVKLGLLSMIPNLVPAFMAFGAWGLFVGEVGLAIAVVGTMTLGIIVDDTVHFLSKYQRARREHAMDAVQAVQYAFSVVGTAMWITSLILIAGFGTLAFSGFKVNSDMGLLAAIAIGFALVVDFLLLPLLLLKFDRQKQAFQQSKANPVEVCFDDANL